MPRVDLELSVDVERTPRVQQLEGLFDVPEKKRMAVDFHFNAPLEEKDWQIGLIVGPSGAGKTSVARHILGDHIIDGYDWDHRRSIVDCFDKDLSIHKITEALNSVGFSSPPSWIKPYHVLSNGEKFRATMARAIIDKRELIVIDEFTSVVDRTVARIGSNAIAKSVRKTPGKRFVAVTCHDDVLDWLQPDWVLEPHVGQFTWRSLLRRPGVNLQVHRALPEAWKFFHKHHYLSSNLHRNSRCWVATIDGYPAAFVAVLPTPHPTATHLRRVHRVVVLPDYQGLGIALRFMEIVGSWARRIGYRMMTHPAHPALIHAQARSAKWRMERKPDFSGKHGGSAGKSGINGMAKTSTTWYRRIACFEYVGPKAADELEARAMWGDDTLNRVKLRD